MATENHRSRDAQSAAVALAFVALGVAGWLETGGMMDADSYVFPRAVIVAMVAFSAVLVVRSLAAAAPARPAARESWPRRLGLAGALLVSAFAIPTAGFVASGLFLFGAATILAMYDPWTRRRRVIYPLVGVVVVLAFYLVFSNYLYVSFPTGGLFR